jgi:hypothetical protein
MRLTHIFLPSYSRTTFAVKVLEKSIQAAAESDAGVIQAKVWETKGRGEMALNFAARLKEEFSFCNVQLRSAI